MPLHQLSIAQFRNLAPLELSCSPGLNLFIGANAAGKTSLLEALFVLARARSFRTRDLAKAIQHGCDQFQVVAHLRTPGKRDIPVGIRRTQTQLMSRIDGRPVQRLSDLAALFPLQWVGGDLHRLLEDGPAYRRRYLDWGMFHVKPAYIPVWQRVRKLLKQRNAALRTAHSTKEIQVWDSALSEAGTELHTLRTAYLKVLEGSLATVTSNLLSLPEPFEIRYRRGWSAESSYAEVLAEGLQRDKDQGFTRSGPHRADFVFQYQGKPVTDRLSRGQQKLLVIALQLAQAQVLKAQTAQPSLFLIDDLGAELDPENQTRVMRLLNDVEAQVFATAIEMPDISGWDTSEMKGFHVKHGQVGEMV